MTGLELAMTEYAATVFQAIVTLAVVGGTGLFALLFVKGRLG